MNDGAHPENILPSGPGSMSQESIREEIANDRYAVIYSAGGLAAYAAVETFIVAPDFVNAVEESNVSDMASNGLGLVFLTGIAFSCVKNIRAYSRRWNQARFNQRLLNISEANGINPSSK